jgi:hypothetical protein
MLALQKGEPHWGNASPFGCILIGLQPQGDWQVIQRAVQWGDDTWANCFGVKREANILYQYFACSIRNRLEVWNSDNFLCPKENHEDIINVQEATQLSSDKTMIEPSTKADDSAILPTSEAEPISSKSVYAIKTELRKTSTAPIPGQLSSKWNKFEVDGRPFSLRRPTKIVDGSRGGQAFMCELLRPDEGHEYSIGDQARMQFLSILLVAVALIRNHRLEHWRDIFKQDFQLDVGLGVVFRRLLIGVVMLQMVVVLFVVSIVYSLVSRNIYGVTAPYVIQICSFASWGVGATGLLMLGGNPRVTMTTKAIPDYIQRRLYESNNTESNSRFRNSDENDNITLSFGSLHGPVYESGAGSAIVPALLVESICSLDIKLTRTKLWYVGMLWFITFMAVSVILQFAGSRVITIGSQAMSVIIIILTALARGAGVSGSERWMIPKWRMRKGAEYGATLLGQMSSRV